MTFRSRLPDRRDRPGHSPGLGSARGLLGARLAPRLAVRARRLAVVFLTTAALLTAALLTAALLTAALLTAALLTVAPTALAGEAPAAPRLLFSGEPATAGDVERLRQIDPARFTGALLLAGLDDPGPAIRVAVLSEDTAVARRTPRWVAGFANGRESAIVVFPARAGNYPYDSLEELLQHEVAHVYIDRAAGGADVPRWLHEGIAMTAGDRWGLEDRSRFAFDVAMSGEVPLASLERRFRSPDVRRAYAISGGFVQHLLRRHGTDVTGDLLARMAAGASIQEAFLAVTGESLAAAEERFWQRQTFWNRWLPLLTSSTVVWTGVALLALVAYRRRKQRSAELMQRWEEEDAPPPPPRRWSPHHDPNDEPGDPAEGQSPESGDRRREWIH